MDISTVQETVEQALVAKADVLLPKASAKLEQTLKDQLEQMRTELGRLSFASSDSVSKQLEKLVTNLESLQQLVTKAEQVEKTRFQTLDGSVKNKLENFETFLKGRLDTLETHVQSRVDLLSADMMTRFGSIDSALERLSTSQEKLEYLVEKLDGIADKLNGVGPKILQQNDRIEACVRERTTSVQGDVNRLIGESSQQNRDHTILVRTLTKSLESLQASVASMGAALSQAPVDSAGTTQLVEMTGTIKHLLDAVSANVKEMVDKASAVPSTRVVPPQRDAVAQPQLCMISLREPLVAGPCHLSLICVLGSQPLLHRGWPRNNRFSRSPWQQRRLLMGARSSYLRMRSWGRPLGARASLLLVALAYGSFSYT